MRDNEYDHRRHLRVPTPRRRATTVAGRSSVEVEPTPELVRRKAEILGGRVSEKHGKIKALFDLGRSTEALDVAWYKGQIGPEMHLAGVRYSQLRHRLFGSGRPGLSSLSQMLPERISTEAAEDGASWWLTEADKEEADWRARKRFGQGSQALRGAGSAAVRAVRRVVLDGEQVREGDILPLRLGLAALVRAWRIVVR